MDCDVVEKLLQTTGLSCEDLLAKLQQYRSKTQSTPQSAPPKDTTDKECSEDSVTSTTLQAEAPMDPTRSNGTTSMKVESEAPTRSNGTTAKMAESEASVDPTRSNGATSGSAEPEAPMDPTRINDTTSRMAEAEPPMDPARSNGTTANMAESETPVDPTRSNGTTSRSAEPEASMDPARGNETTSRMAESEPPMDPTRSNGTTAKMAESEAPMDPTRSNGTTSGSAEPEASMDPTVSNGTTSRMAESEPPMDPTRSNGTTAKMAESEAAMDPTRSNGLAVPEASMDPTRSNGATPRMAESEPPRSTSTMVEPGTPTDPTRNDNPDEDAPNDHNYSTSSEPEAPVDLPQSEESIRDSLRLQLSSLRNMKKSNEYLPDLKKTSLFFQNLKKKRKSCEVNQTDVLSVSEDIGFQIVEVSGGVDRLTPDPEGKEKKEESPKMYKKKRLITDIDEGVGVSIKNMSDNFNEDPGVKKSVKNSEKSPFVSDSLDDFLNESAKLQVSYPIPKLGAEEGIVEGTKSSPFVRNTKEVITLPKMEPQKERPKLVKAKTLAEKRRQFEKLKAKQQQEIKTTKPETRGLPRNSYVFFEGKKIRTSSKKSHCLGAINSKLEPCKVTSKRPSLLATLDKKRRPRAVTYKPGPLSKKAMLQNEDSKRNWVVEVKTLPKIFLEVIPEVNRAVDPKLQHLIPVFDDPIVTSERARFALTALKPKDTNVQSEAFTFPVAYRNGQDKVVVRRRRDPLVQPPKLVEKVDLASDVKGVIDDIIGYIEVKEIADSLIKEETVEEESQVLETSPKTKKKTKRRRIDLEMQRLSCKVIDVASKDADDGNCSKPFCRLGCVCKSLLCESVFSNHCQLVECMFECKCPPAKSEESLSKTAVSHLEDQAKRNLAKVEKEFTQTLIHTDDDAILVGSAKVRRSTKLPKKYTDYISNDFFDNRDHVISEEELQRAKKCAVALEKVDLDGIVPLCLYHRQYNCSCGGKAEIEPTKVGPKVRNTKVGPKSRKTEEVAKSKDEQIPKLLIVKTKEDEHKPWNESCARIRSVFPQYKERNKSKKYNERLWKHNRQSSASEDPTPPVVTDLQKPSKRKQSFTIRQDFDKEFAIQRRKKKNKVYTPVFDGEIKLTLEDNNDMLKVIGTDNANLEYLRILPWTNLIESFRLRMVDIWAKDEKSLLFCNTAGHRPPNDFMDIRRISKRSELVNWILTDTLPVEANRSMMHLILTPKNGHYMIAGYCLKQIEKPSEGSGFQEIHATNKPTSSFSQKRNLLPKPPSRSEVPTLQQVVKTQETTKAKTVAERKPLFVPPYEKKRKYGDLIKKLNSNVEEIYVEPSSTRSRVERVEDPLELNLNQNLTSLLDKETSNDQSDNDDGLSLLNLLNKTVHVREDPLALPDLLQQLTREEPKKPEGIIANTKIPEEGSDSQKSGILKKAPSDPLGLPVPVIVVQNDTEKKKQKCAVENIPKKQPIDPLELLPKDTPPSKTKPAPKRSRLFDKAPALIPSRSMKCTHKDMHNANKTLILTNKVFHKRTLYSRKDGKTTEISLQLPQVTKNVKWRMIYLNSDFTYLAFSKSNYSIKYTDLMDVVKMAGNINATITLRNKEFCDHYKHPQFGIFCCPGQQDRLFIGPYWSTENHHVETLRYLQGRLIDTLIFNSMVGKKGSVKDPVWVSETPMKPVSLPNGLVIDITDDDVELVADDEHLLTRPFVEELSMQELKAKRNINRYIMTNIPHLGYFRAWQRDNKAVEVYWPDGSKGYRFSSVTFAKNLLTQYLSQIFCPVPADFKINVIVMTNLIANNKPIDTKYFSRPGPFFCGDFGILEKSVPDDILKTCNAPSVDALLVAHKESRESAESMVRIFGQFLMSNEELQRHNDPADILKWAQSEIYIQKRLTDNYESQKTDLKNMIRVNTRKLHALPRKPVPTTSEPIEIKDSDEEEPEAAQSVFKKISTSGRIGTEGVFGSSNGRSLLKANVIKPGASLLKSDKSPSC